VEDQTATSTGIYNANATITYTSATVGDLAPYGFPGVPYVMGTITFAHSRSPTVPRPPRAAAATDCQRDSYERVDKKTLSAPVGFERRHRVPVDATIRRSAWYVSSRFS
jgi:hypothetical protein